jgi:hypothetical protein
VLDTTIELISAFGPIALAIMGVVVSIRPPSSRGARHIVWAAAFGAVGLLTAVCNFYELRGTDTILTQIWEKLTETKGPRMQFSGLSPDNSSGKVGLGFLNSSDVDAVAYNLHGAILITAKDDENEIIKQFSNMKNDLSAQLKLERVSLPLSKGDERVWVTPDMPAQSAMNALLSGNAHGYILALAIYIGQDTPEGYLWATQVCLMIQKWPNDLVPCKSHNGYFYSKDMLSQIH